MIRVLVVCCVFSGVFVGWLRIRRSGRLLLETAKTDAIAALLIAFLVWLLWLVRY